MLLIRTIFVRKSNKYTSSFLKACWSVQKFNKTIKLFLIRKTETIRSFFYLLAAKAGCHQSITSGLISADCLLQQRALIPTDNKTPTAVAPDRYLRLPLAIKPTWLMWISSVCRGKSWLICFRFAERLRVETGLVHRLRVFGWSDDVPGREVLFPRLHAGTDFLLF